MSDSDVVPMVLAAGAVIPGSRQQRALAALRHSEPVKLVRDTAAGGVAIFTLAGVNLGCLEGDAGGAADALDSGAPVSARIAAIRADAGRVEVDLEILHGVKQRNHIGTGSIIGLAALGLLGAAIVAGKINPPSPPALDPSTTENAEHETQQFPLVAARRTVTAREMFREYQANEARAQQRYDGGPLQVSGEVDGVDLDFLNHPVVKLRTDNEFMSAMVNLVADDQPHAADLNAGDQITVVCERASEIAGTPVLHDCRFKP